MAFSCAHTVWHGVGQFSLYNSSSRGHCLDVPVVYAFSVLVTKSLRLALLCTTLCPGHLLKHDVWRFIHAHHPTVLGPTLVPRSTFHIPSDVSKMIHCKHQPSRSQAICCCPLVGTSKHPNLGSKRQPEPKL